MSDVSFLKNIKGINYQVTWHSIPDKRRCRICEGLEGHVWTFQEALPPLLEHSTFGIVWNLEGNHSVAHEFQGGLSINCRCYLDITIDVNVDQMELDEGNGNMVNLEEAKQQIAELKTELNSLSMNYHQLREVETSLNRILGWLEEAAGTKDVAKFYSLMQKAIAAGRMLQMLIIQVQTVSGPIGWLMLGTSAVATAMTAGSIMQEIGNH